MKVTRIEYEACFNLGDYENEKVRLCAQLDTDESTEEVVSQLRTAATSAALEAPWKVEGRVYEAQRQLRALETKLEKKTDEWNQMAEFLRTQGIKAEAQPMPQFTKLLEPSLQQEQTEVVEGEFDDDDDDDLALAF